jgi:hypothetical protein
LLTPGGDYDCGFVVLGVLNIGHAFFIPQLSEL